MIIDLGPPTAPDFPELNSNALATAAAIIGGIIVKIVDKWASKKSVNTTFVEAERIRAELRLDVDRLHNERGDLHTEINRLESENYDLRTQLYSITHVAQVAPPVSGSIPSN